MKKFLIIALLIYLVMPSLGAIYDPFDMLRGKQMVPYGSLWSADDQSMYFGTGKDVSLSYDDSQDKFYVNDTDVYLEEDVTIAGNLGVSGTTISNGKTTDPFWVDDLFYVTSTADLNRTKTDQFESSTRADLNRTRITQLDVSARSSLNRTAASQFDVSGLTGLNATIASRPIAQPVSAELTDGATYTVSNDQYFIPVDASAKNITVTLPVATGNTGRSYVVMATKDPGSYYIRITATSGSLIRPRGVAAGSTYLSLIHI